MNSASIKSHEKFEAIMDFAGRSARFLDGDDTEKPIFMEDACDITGYRKSYIYLLICKKEIPFHKIAGKKKIFFYRSELLKWMNSANVKEVIQ
jgi:excisionase family DNA binding protein